MHSNVTIKNVSWPHFSWPTLYVRIYKDVFTGYVCYMHCRYVSAFKTYAVSSVIAVQCSYRCDASLRHMIPTDRVLTVCADLVIPG